MPVNREITFLIVIIGGGMNSKSFSFQIIILLLFCVNLSFYRETIISCHYARNIIKNDTLTRQMTNDSNEEDRSESN